MREYYQLMKPGIVYGNAMTAIAGYFLAAKGDFHLGLFLAMLVGISLIIGASCVYNNYLDRDIDKLMLRTKKRALVEGTVSPKQALLFATILAGIGVILLGGYTNMLTLLIALFGMFAYIVLYGLGKRKTVHGTLIGSLSGAIPPVVGYVAVTGHIDLAAGLLFVILICWQMPHFYAIALFRSQDYKAANIPVLPLVSGLRTTKIQIMLYAAAFTISTSLLTLSHYTGYVYLVSMSIISIMWILCGLNGFNTTDNQAWGRQMFFLSLLVITLWSILVSLTAWLP